MKDDFFVTGTDTNVGKTVLVRAARRRARWSLLETDSNGRVRRNRPPNRDALAEVPEAQTLPECYCFDPPVSPHLAAEAGGVRIDLGRIRASGAPIAERSADRRRRRRNSRCRQRFASRCWMWCASSDMPVIVASRSALGTINHTVLTVNALRIAGADVRGVVMIGKKSKDNERAVERFARAPVIGRIPRLECIDRDTLLETFHANFDARYFHRDAR